MSYISHYRQWLYAQWLYAQWLYAQWLYAQLYHVLRDSRELDLVEKKDTSVILSLRPYQRTQTISALDYIEKVTFLTFCH